MYGLYIGHHILYLCNFKLLRRKLLDARGRVTGDSRLVEVYNHGL